MDLVTGAMGNLVPKLLQLLEDEYKLQKGVRAQVRSLAEELRSMHVALGKVAQVPYDGLDPQVKLWASEIREASYDMEDILDTFFVRVDGGHQSVDADKARVKRLLDKMGKLFSLSKLKARHDIAGAIEDIKKQVDEMAKRRDRYKVDDHVANSTTATSIDPRILTLQTKVGDLVGISEPRDELIKILTLGDDDASHKKIKIVSVVGPGGLGKTTLAKVVYEKLTVDINFHCKAFVPVGQNPEYKKVYRDILLALDKEYYSNKINFMILDEGQLIEEVQDFLKEKRYFIVIDDVWEISTWNAIRNALEDKNMGSKIIITTRCTDVAANVHCCYKLKPLLPESSKKLFHGRIFASNSECPQQLYELSEQILKKCGGVPLAIVTTASLLANKSADASEWQEVCDAIGSGLSNSHDMCNMRKILSLSYYNLPLHMKTCFLYLSMYPEDYEIEKDRLIWRWIAEGFIQHQKKDDDLFEHGESYFNDLINRSLIQPVGTVDSLDGIYACRVHDMILDLIHSLAKEENFVATSDDIEQVISSVGKKLRRLSLKNTTWGPDKGVSQVRSIAIFQPSIGSLPSFSCFVMLRVLDLEGCSLEGCEGSKLRVGELIHLRYLGLKFTSIPDGPEGIEKLQFLQVLKMDIFGSGMLPLPIFGLPRLMCLEGGKCHPRPGSMLRNLKSLLVLDELCVDEDSAGAVEELRHLTQLTELVIQVTLRMNESICNALIDSLGNLPRLQRLEIWHDWSLGNNLIKWERWAPPSRLRWLLMNGDFSLQTLPKWISPTSLPHLIYLNLSLINVVRPDDLQILGMLPNLRYLVLTADLGNFSQCQLQKFMVNADAFPRATHCFFFNVVTIPSMFARGAMPRVEHIQFCLRARDFFSSGGLGFHDLGMEHLPSLRVVEFSVHWETAVSEEEVTKLRAALKHATDVHPNHPSFVEHAV